MKMMSSSHSPDDSYSSFFTPPLHLQRKQHIASFLSSSSPKINSVLFVGCGNGSVMKYLAYEGLSMICGIDKDREALETAIESLHPSNFPNVWYPMTATFRVVDVTRTSLPPSWLAEASFDSVVCTEVIEHMEHPRETAQCLRFIFDFVRPAHVILSTPNREFNSWWPSSPDRPFRHDDHHFEFSRREFGEFSEEIVRQYGHLGYELLAIDGVGECTWSGNPSVDPLQLGYASQFAKFVRRLPEASEEGRFENASREDPPALQVWQYEPKSNWNWGRDKWKKSSSEDGDDEDWGGSWGSAPDWSGSSSNWKTDSTPSSSSRSNLLEQIRRLHGRACQFRLFPGEEWCPIRWIHSKLSLLRGFENVSVGRVREVCGEEQAVRRLEFDGSGDRIRFVEGVEGTEGNGDNDVVMRMERRPDSADPLQKFVGEY